MTGTNLGYTEIPGHLSSRISIHEKYSKREINDWILECLKVKSNDVILDLGCGNGKQVKAYANVIGPEGHVVGADFNEALLQQARKTIGNNPSKFEFVLQDLDEPFRWADSTFNAVSSCFAIYYVKDLNKTLSEIKRVLKKQGRLFLCGPTENNSAELNRLHEQATHKEVPQKGIIRSRRLQEEVLPIARKLFDSVRVELFRNKVLFPSTGFFMEYYSSTLLFREAVMPQDRGDVLKRLEAEVTKIISEKGNLEITKEVIGIIASR